jgi:hypothetical protein
MAFTNVYDTGMLFHIAERSLFLSRRYRDVIWL